MHQVESDFYFDNARKAFVNNAFDPLTLDFTKDPQHFFAEAHRHAPLFYSETKRAWFVFSNQQVRDIFLNSTLQKSRAGLTVDKLADEKERWPLRYFHHNESAITVPEKHMLFRSLMAEDFRPQLVAKMENTVNQVVDDACRVIRGGGAYDAVEVFKMIPLRVLAVVLGFTGREEYGEIFKQYAPVIVRTASPLLSEREKDDVEYAFARVYEIVREVVAERRAAPKNDLISQILENSRDLPEISDKDILSALTILIAAGADTTAQSSLLMLRTFLKHRDALGDSLDNPAMIAPAVAEFLRYEHPAKFQSRVAHGDIAIGDGVIPANSVVMVSAHGANWDSAFFPEPQQLDISRTQRHNVTFGQGKHFCLGTHLARLQLTSMLTYLYRYTPRANRADEQAIEWHADDLIMRVIKRFPVTNG